MSQRSLSACSVPLPNASREGFQQCFLDRIGGAADMRLLFDYIDGVCFFMKDREGRFIDIGNGPRQDFNHHEKELIGRTDYDLYSKHIADRIREDDHRVMALDRPLLNIIEILVNPLFHTIGWYMTNKFPVHDKAGQVIGIMGTVQPFASRRKIILSGTRLDKALDYIEDHCARELCVEALARTAAMSPRQFRRKFDEVLGMPPQDYILRTRLMKACTALVKTEKSIAEIALESAFYDQSAMALQFRLIIGITPKEYRQRYATHAATRLCSRGLTKGIS